MPVTNYYTANGELLGEKTSGGSRTDYLTDALGSVVATLNPSAQVANTYRYKPYGAQLAKTGVGADPAFRWVGSLGYRQTGKAWSDVYVRARHYDTNTGRWTTVDRLWPWEYAYGYARSTPGVLVDRTGLRCQQPLDCSRICDLLDQRGFWSRFQGVGTTICCLEKAYVCFAPDIEQRARDAYGPNAKAVQCIVDCARQHEKTHEPDCGPRCKEHPELGPVFGCPVEPGEECRIYTLEVGCLLRCARESGCTKDPSCLQEIWRRLCRICSPDLAGKDCGRVKMPIPGVCLVCEWFPPRPLLPSSGTKRTGGMIRR